jgi:hypothetical protein
MAGLFDQVLPGLFSYGDQLKRGVRGLLADPAGFAGGVVSRAKGDPASNLRQQIQGETSLGLGVLGSDPALRQQAAGAQRAQAMDMAMNALTFAGVGAKTADLAAKAKAETLEAKGVDPRQIWGETGWFRAPWDKKWRWEIADSDAAMKLDYVARDPFQRVYEQNSKMNYQRVKDTMYHNDLFSAYPDIAPIRLRPEANSKASYMPAADGLPEFIGVGRDWDTLLSNTLHETQHAIQQREGWARGGSPDEFGQQKDAELARDALSWAREIQSKRKQMPGADLNAIENSIVRDYQSVDAMDWLVSRDARDLGRQPAVLYPDKYPDQRDAEQLLEIVKLYGLDKGVTPRTNSQLYRLLAGEAEARLTQKRLNYTPAQRRGLFPLDELDVPADQLIVRGLLD